MVGSKRGYKSQEYFSAGSTPGRRTPLHSPDLHKKAHDNLHHRGLSNAFGVFQTYYEQELPQSPSEISWIGSLQALLLIGVGVLAGPAYDAGFFTELFWAVALLVPFGFMMTSLSKEYWQIILAQGLTPLIALPSRNDRLLIQR